MGGKAKPSRRNISAFCGSKWSQAIASAGFKGGLRVSSPISLLIQIEIADYETGGDSLQLTRAEFEERSEAE